MPEMWMDVDTALSEVPVNLMPLIDDTTFKDIEDAVAYNASGMALRWHFVTTGGAYTVTSVTPTTGGDYDWTDQGDSGIYTIEIPASGGASINNDTEGFGWFTGKATGVLPWRGPVIGFRAAALNNLLIDDAYSTTRGLAGTALPNAAADAAGGLVISDAGGFDIDNRAASATSVGNMNIVFNTDFATNYNTTVDKWNVNLVDISGSAVSVMSAQLGVRVVEMASDSITAGVVADGTIDAATFAANAITATSIASDAFTASKFASDVTTEFQSGLATAANLATLTAYVDTEVAAIVAAIGTVTDISSGATLGANLTDINSFISTQLDAAISTRASQTSVNTIDDLLDSEIGTLTTELAKVPKSDSTVTWNATALASIQAEANDALIANNLDHLVLSAVDTDFATTVHLNSVIGHLADAGTSATFDRTTDALEALGAATAPSAASIADAVWTEAVADHSGVSGSTAEALAAAGGAGDPWITALPGSYSSGQAGYIVGTNLNATVSSRATQTSVDTIDDLIDTEVASLTSELAKVPKSDGSVTWNATALASINSQCDTALSDYDGPTNAEMVARTLVAASYATASVLSDVNIYVQLSASDIGELHEWHEAYFHQTTIATLASQTSFTLTAGSGDNDVYNGCEIVIESNTQYQRCIGVVSDYVGSTLTVTLAADPGIFTIATGDRVTIRLRTTDATGIRTAIGLASANLDTQLGNIPTVSEFEARTLVAASYFDPAADTVTVGTNNDKTGYSISGTITTLDALDTAQDTQHGTTQTAIADLPTNSELAAAIITGLTTALTEGYRSTGATGSVRDILYELLALLANNGIVGTTMTTTKLDKATTAKTYTLNDGTTPTAIEETT